VGVTNIVIPLLSRQIHQHGVAAEAEVLRWYSYKLKGGELQPFVVLRYQVDREHYTIKRRDLDLKYAPGDKVSVLHSPWIARLALTAEEVRQGHHLFQTPVRKGLLRGSVCLLLMLVIYWRAIVHRMKTWRLTRPDLKNLIKVLLFYTGVTLVAVLLALKVESWRDAGTDEWCKGIRRMAQIKRAVQAHARDHPRPLANLMDLPSRYAPFLLCDPYGRPYEFSTKKGRAELRWYGRDRTRGGSGVNSDFAVTFNIALRR